MKEFIDKLISRLEELKTFKIGMADAMSELIKKDRIDNYISREDAISIVNELAEEYRGKYVGIGAFEQVRWERDIAISQLKELGYEFGQKIDKVSEMPTGWIPCERELPKEDKRVLCQGKNGMFIGFVDSFDGEWRDNHHYRRTAVKAWCELPAPYTEGE